MRKLRCLGKLALAVMLCVTLGAVWLPAAPALAATDCTAFAGAGTESDPYIVDDEKTLDAVRHCQQAGTHFKLTADISLAGVDWVPIPDFAGVLDGNGHAVTGLTVDADPDEPAGLFANIAKTAVVRNLTLRNVSITGDAAAGALAGQSSGEISDVRVTSGTVTSTGDDVGGLVGVNRGTIRGASAAVSVSGAARVGGLVGINWQGQTLIQCSQSAGKGVSGSPRTSPARAAATYGLRSAAVSSRHSVDCCCGGAVHGLASSCEGPASCRPFTMA